MAPTILAQPFDIYAPLMRCLILILFVISRTDSRESDVGQSREFSIPIPLQSLTQSSTSNVVLTAYSIFRDHNGVEHNITWHATVPGGLGPIEEISGTVKCLQGITAQWVNLTIAPVVLMPHAVNGTSPRAVNGARKDEPKRKMEVTTRKPTTVHRTTSHHSTNITTHDNLTTSGGPSHCDPLPHLGTKSDTLSIPLTSSATSDPEGVDITELDAHKLERVANYTLQKHNCLRTRVSPTAGNMLKMEWNQEAADQAQNWADQCSYNHNNETNRTTSLFACGQNIAYTTPWAFSWNSVINMWFNEQTEYKFSEPNDLHTVGHYTAMIWATTYQLGCAYKDCGGWHFYVCHYCPNGNYGDLSAPYKAGHPCELCPDSCDRGLCTNSCPHTNVYSNCDELERKYKVCSNRFQERLALNCKATCLCPGGIYL